MSWVKTNNQFATGEETTLVNALKLVDPNISDSMSKNTIKYILSKREEWKPSGSEGLTDAKAKELANKYYNAYKNQQTMIYVGSAVAALTVVGIGGWVYWNKRQKNAPRY